MRAVRHSLLLAILVTTVAGLDVRAQVPADYTAIVSLYAAGRGVEAVTALLGRAKDDVTTAARAAATLPAPERIAAAMLHTEAALAVVDARLFDATFHVDTARTILQGATRDPSGRDRIDTFARRWYALAASLFVSASRMEQAAWYIREGLQAFPRDTALYFVRGTIAEKSIQIGWDRDLRRDLPESSADRTRIENLLKRAVADYQRALNIDRHFGPAHLHVGWIRLFLHTGGARAELESAAADGADRRTRYLAYLFLGGLAEREKRLDAARTAYEAALAEGPGFQSAYLRLSRLEDSVGNSARAQDLAVRCAQLRKDDPDPWWDYAASFDREMLIDLRAEARRR